MLAKRHTLLGTSLRHLAATALIMEDGLTLDARMGNATGETMDAKKTLLTITGCKGIASDVIWSFSRVTIPVQR